MRALCLLSVLGWATSAASAQDPFIGAWTLQPQKSRMPDEMKVAHQDAQTYTFDFGAAPETIVVDGSDQPGYDNTLLSVQPVAADTWIVRRKKAGRLWIEATWKLSAHGRTLTDAYRQFEPDGSSVSMDYVYRRVGDGAGFAADWQSTRETMNSPFVLDVKTYGDNGLSFASPMGKTDATFDDGGAAAAETPATAKTIHRVDARTLAITIRRDGKTLANEDVVLSADRKTLTLTLHVAGRARPTVLVFERA